MQTNTYLPDPNAPANLWQHPNQQWYATWKPPTTNTRLAAPINTQAAYEAITGKRDYRDLYTNNTTAILKLEPGNPTPTPATKINKTQLPKPGWRADFSAPAPHKHGTYTHTHAWPHIPHTHMLRQICTNQACTDLPTHDIHPAPKPLITTTPTNL